MQARQRPHLSGWNRTRAETQQDRVPKTVQEQIADWLWAAFHSYHFIEGCSLITEGVFAFNRSTQGLQFAFAGAAQEFLREACDESRRRGTNAGNM